MRILSASASSSLAPLLVDVPESVQSVVALPSVGDDPRARLDVVTDEAVEGVS
jgi:hypothetical protein